MIFCLIIFFRKQIVGMFFFYYKASQVGLGMHCTTGDDVTLFAVSELGKS